MASSSAGHVADESDYRVYIDLDPTTPENSSSHEHLDGVNADESVQAFYIDLDPSPENSSSHEHLGGVNAVPTPSRAVRESAHAVPTDLVPTSENSSSHERLGESPAELGMDCDSSEVDTIRDCIDTCFHVSSEGVLSASEESALEDFEGRTIESVGEAPTDAFDDDGYDIHEDYDDDDAMGDDDLSDDSMLHSDVELDAENQPPPPPPPPAGVIAPTTATELRQERRLLRVKLNMQPAHILDLAGELHQAGEFEMLQQLVSISDVLFDSFCRAYARRLHERHDSVVGTVYQLVMAGEWGVLQEVLSRHDRWFEILCRHVAKISRRDK